MGGFGDLFGSLGDLIGGIAEGVSVVQEASGGAEGPRAYDPNDAVDRWLTGAPKALNVNDI